MSMTAKQAAEVTGRSVSWLRRHECGWCGQTAINAVRYGCSAIGEKCDPATRMLSAEASAASKPAGLKTQSPEGS